jgi:hypothetical protein
MMDMSYDHDNEASKCELWSLNDIILLFRFFPASRV